MDLKMVWSVGPMTSMPSALHAGLDLQHGVDGVGLQRQVLRPRGGVGVRGRDHVGLGGQLEKGQDVAAADVDEDVHVRVRPLVEGTSFSAMARMKRASRYF
jgi:hypothetical protein